MERARVPIRAELSPQTANAHQEIADDTLEADGRTLPSIPAAAARAPASALRSTTGTDSYYQRRTQLLLHRDTAKDERVAAHLNRIRALIVKDCEPVERYDVLVMEVTTGMHPYPKCANGYTRIIHACQRCKEIDYAAAASALARCLARRRTAVLLDSVVARFSTSRCFTMSAYPK